MQRFRSDFRREAGRAPYGARGLKLNSVGVDLEHGQSRPVWGAWIEITFWLHPHKNRHPRRAPYGARGLKFPAQWEAADAIEVAPRMGRVD